MGEKRMPYVTVKMIAGRTDEQKRALVEKVTDAVVETTGAPIEAVTVFIEEMTKDHYAVAGKRLSDQ
jgi:4-oxalocrotonate tautomerase